jgi:nucleoside-diphosphate-sugar epimerase
VTSLPPETAGTVVVAGATSLVGHFLLPRLHAAGLRVHALSRRPSPAGEGAAATWHQVDVAEGLERLELPRSFQLVSLVPLWLAPALVRGLGPRGLRRVIAFGSTSRFTKRESTDPHEREIAHQLAAAEDELRRASAATGVAWTLFRPTLVYGDDLDGNVAVIARFVRRFRFFPLPGAGRGRRQPVHADDLARACLAALDEPASFGRAYDLSGGSTLTYREMVEEVFRGLGRRPRIVVMPAPLVGGAVRALARLHPSYAHVRPQMADRVEEDLCFDHGDAVRDFGYAPRPFTYRSRAGGATPPARSTGNA